MPSDSADKDVGFDDAEDELTPHQEAVLEQMMAASRQTDPTIRRALRRAFRSALALEHIPTNLPLTSEERELLGSIRDATETYKASIGAPKAPRR